MIKIPAPIFSRFDRESPSQFGQTEREFEAPEEPPAGAHVIRSTKFIEVPPTKKESNK